MVKKNSFITWNGVSSEMFGLHVEKYPNLNRPSRKYTAADIPGRNGSAYILEEAWSETVQAYEISVKSPVVNFKKIAEWLNSADGYAVLEDSYDPWIYRMAVMVDGFDATNTLQRAGKALIQFRCRPERYLKTQPLEIEGGSYKEIENITPHDAHPLIKIEGQGYPSMLPTTERTNVENSYTDSYDIKGLSAAKVRYNFLGLSVPVKEEFGGEETGYFLIDQKPTKINSFSATEGTINITAMEANYGVGLNRSVNPLTTYTLSFLHGTSNTRTNRLAIILTDKDGLMINLAGIYDISPIAARRSITFKTTADSYWAVFIFISSGGMTAPCIFEDIQLNFGAESKPYAPYSDSTASAIMFGDTLIRLSELGDYMYIDCETMNAFREAGQNLNPLVSITDEFGNLTANFPRLVPGVNFINTHPSSDYIDFGDNDWITKVTIEPRFWSL